MQKKKLVTSAVSLSIILSCTAAFAQQGSISEYAMGTRSLALGRMATTSFSDALAISLNPANATNARAITASIFYSKLGGGALSASGGAILPTASHGTFGMSYYQTRADYPEFNENGEQIGTGTFSQRHLLLTYARPIAKNFAVGFNAKFVRQRVGDEVSGPENIGIDVGIQYAPVFTNSILKNLAFGFSVDNLIAPTLKIADKREALLREFRFIVEKEIFFSGSSINLIANVNSKEEYVHQNEASPNTVKQMSRPRVHFGAEFSRGGYAVRIGSDSGSLATGLAITIQSLSFGLAYTRSESYRANYAFSVNYGF